MGRNRRGGLRPESRPTRDDGGHRRRTSERILPTSGAISPRPSPRRRAIRDRLWIDDSKAILKGAGGGTARSRLPGQPRSHRACNSLARSASCSERSRGELSPRSSFELWLDEERPSPGLGPHRANSSSVGPSIRSRGVPWRIIGIETRGRRPGCGSMRGLAPRGIQSHGPLRRVSRTCSARSGSVPVTECRRRFVRTSMARPPFLYGTAPSPLRRRLRSTAAPKAPQLSQYTVKSPAGGPRAQPGPRADADDGLVALASIVRYSKIVREGWMDAFNAHWRSRFPDLRPTASVTQRSPSGSARRDRFPECCQGIAAVVPLCVSARQVNWGVWPLRPWLRGTGQTWPESSPRAVAAM